MTNELVNKVNESTLVTLDLENFFPTDEVVLFDLKDYLFMGLILKEKDFRESLKSLDFTVYQNKLVTVFCTADAIIPMWAYMLVSSYLQPIAKKVLYGNIENAKTQLLVSNISSIDVSKYINQRVVIKGCGDLPIGEQAYLTITNILRPVVKSIMYGEPCSTVPIFKNK